MDMSFLLMIKQPGAGSPHARICGGESRMAELSDHPHGRRCFRDCLHGIAHQVEYHLLDLDTINQHDVIRAELKFHNHPGLSSAEQNDLVPHALSAGLGR